MKKYLLFSGLVAFALAGCVNNDDVTVSEEIDFTPVAYKAQKAPILNSVYPEDRPFQVWGYYLKNLSFANIYTIKSGSRSAA